MQLLEIVVQGVPGIQGILKYPFQPGFNGWKQKGAFPLETLVDLIASLFYPSTGQGEPLGPGRAQKAGMTFEARGTTYRLVRDYVGKTLHLGQLEAGSQDRFRELSKDSRFITAALARSAQIPSQKIFRGLLVARRGASLLPKTNTGMEMAEAPATSATAQERLDELKREQANMKMIHDLEFELDDVQQRSFKIDEQLRRLEEPMQKLSQIAKEYESLKVFDSPGLINAAVMEKLRAFPKAKEKLQEDLANLDQKAKEGSEQLILLPEQPIWRDPFAMTGGGIALSAFLGASLYRPWLWLFLGLFVLSLALMVWGLWMGHDRSEKIHRIQKQIRDLDSEKAGIQKRFEIETNVVRRLFATVNIRDADEVLDLLAHRDQLLKDRYECEETLKKIREEVSEKQLKDEKEIVIQRIAQIEAGLREIPPASVDPNALEREIQELEAALKSDTVPPEYDAPALPDDDINRLLVYAAELLDRPVPALLNQIQQGLAANLAILTQGKFNDIEARGGQIAGFRKADGTSVKWALSEALRPVLSFAVQFTLWQILAAQRPLPLIVDLIGGTPDEGLTAVSVKAAQFVAKQTQVIVLSA